MPQHAAYPICHHVKTNGLRCQSPAHGVSAFCYHHRKLRRPAASRPRPSEFSAIRQTIAIVTQESSNGTLDPYDATVMLRALNYAANLHATRAESRS
jgi:hypothetical protein